MLPHDGEHLRLPAFASAREKSLKEKEEEEEEKNIRIQTMMDDHQLLMTQHSFYIPLHEAVHQVLVEEEGDGVVWVSYTGLTTCRCLPLTFTHEDLETLIVGDGNDNPADLFGVDHPLAEVTLLKEMLEELISRPVSRRLALMYFFNKETTFYYPTNIPLLNFKE